MRTSLTLAAAFLLWMSAPGAAQTTREPQLHCYGSMTNGGTIARRDFYDARGFVEQEIHYGPESSRFTPGRVYTTAEYTSCVEENLRPVGIRTYKRDDLGRALVQTDSLANGRVERRMRHDYTGDSKRPAQTVIFGADDTPQSEMRYRAEGTGWTQVTTLRFERDGRVAAVQGHVPSGREFAFAWRPMTAAFRWGIALEVFGDPRELPSLFVNLQNVSSQHASIPAVATFETDLRDAAGGVIVPTTEALSHFHKYGAQAGPLESGEAGYLWFSLDSLYGALRPGRYSLKVSHRDPKTLETYESNTVTFDVASRP